jgi:hypothetical protein
MTYLARTENLKLTLQKTKKGLMPYQEGTGWRDVIIFVGGCAWWVSILGQLVYHLMGLSLQTEKVEGSSFPVCLIQSAVTRSTEFGCYRSMTSLMPMFLLSGLLSIWWNNKLSKSASGYGRLTNLNDYYFSQLIFLIIRLAAFWSLRTQRHSAFPERINGAAIVFIIVVSKSITRCLPLLNFLVCHVNSENSPN